MFDVGEKTLCQRLFTHCSGEITVSFTYMEKHHLKKIQSMSKSIRHWPEDDRPREKMIARGPMALTDAELLAILINHGSGGQSALDLAREILILSEQNLDELGKLGLAEIRQIRGIGSAKAVSIMAALELGRRRHGASRLGRHLVRSSSDIAGFLQASLKDLGHEVFAVVYLNQANKINHLEIISQGGITGTVADPRIILRRALEEKATSIVLCHNHPSGNLSPSQADKEITKKIKHAAAYMDIRVLDHIIVSDEGYYSFADEGML